MRQTYIVRLATLQAKIYAAPATETGQLFRQFLAHEAMTSRNIRRANLLKTELLTMISKVDLSSLTGSLPYSNEFVLSTIYVKSDQLIIVQIYNPKWQKVIFKEQSFVNVYDNIRI